jgi:hypothetical protein
MWKVEGAWEGPFERGNLERKTPYQVLTIWIAHSKSYWKEWRRQRAVAGVVDGSIYHTADKTQKSGSPCTPTNAAKSNTGVFSTTFNTIFEYL